MSFTSSRESFEQPGPASLSFRKVLGAAMRYWESRRIGYNAILAIVVLGWLILSWPHFRAAVVPRSLLPLGVLAVMANVCYCAVYIVDLFMQSALRIGWCKWRWCVWVAGTVFASALAFYWIADEIYPLFG
jgi:hypothetical protein